MTTDIYPKPDDAKLVNGIRYFDKHYKELGKKTNKKLCVYLIPKCSLLKSLNNKPLLYVGEMDEKLAPEWAAFLKQEGAIKGKCLCEKTPEGLSMKIRSKTFKKEAELIELLASNGIKAEFVAKLSKDDTDTDDDDSEVAPQDKAPQSNSDNNSKKETAPAVNANDVRKTLDELKKQIDPLLSVMSPLGKDAMAKKSIPAETAKKAEDLAALLDKFNSNHQSAPDNVKILFAPFLKNVEAYKTFWAKVEQSAGTKGGDDAPDPKAVKAKDTILQQQEAIKKLFSEMEQLLGKK